MPETIKNPESIARAVALEVAEEPGHVGDFVEAIDLGDNVTDFRFESLLRGYEGWQWSVTLYHDIERDEWTVNESSLTPTDKALRPPEWIPWKDRLLPTDLSVTDSIGTDPGDPRLEEGVRSIDDVVDAVDAVGTVVDQAADGVQPAISTDQNSTDHDSTKRDTASAASSTLAERVANTDTADTTSATSGISSSDVSSASVATLANTASVAAISGDTESTDTESGDAEATEAAAADTESAEKPAVGGYDDTAADTVSENAAEASGVDESSDDSASQQSTESDVIADAQTHNENTGDIADSGVTQDVANADAASGDFASADAASADGTAGAIAPDSDTVQGTQQGSLTSVDDIKDAVTAFDLSRRHVLTSLGRAQTAKRWYEGPRGPKSLSTKTAAGNLCSTCGFCVPIQGELGVMFGVCANKWSPDDGRVVSLDHGCGEHSEIDPPEPTHLWVQSKPAFDDLHIDIIAQAPREERGDVELIEALNDNDEIEDNNELDDNVELSNSDDELSDTREDLMEEESSDEELDDSDSANIVDDTDVATIGSLDVVTEADASTPDTDCVMDDDASTQSVMLDADANDTYDVDDIADATDIGDVSLEDTEDTDDTEEAEEAEDNDVAEDTSVDDAGADESDDASVEDAVSANDATDEGIAVDSDIHEIVSDVDDLSDGDIASGDMADGIADNSEAYTAQQAEQPAEQTAAEQVAEQTVEQTTTEHDLMQQDPAQHDSAEESTIE